MTKLPGGTAAASGGHVRETHTHDPMSVAREYQFAGLDGLV
jgi:hypothetical protein